MPRSSVFRHAASHSRSAGRLGLSIAALLSASPLALAQNFNAAPPNARGQTPAFENQTRAPVIDDGLKMESAIVAEGLEHPWGMDQLPDGRWLVTERPGRLRIISQDGTVSEPLSGLPTVDGRRQGGLLDVVIQDDFDTTRRIWISYSEPRGNDTTGTAVATATLSEDETQLENLEVIFQQQPAWRSTMHYGSRLVFDQNGALFVTLGERSVPSARPLAQDPGTHLGKVVRISPQGGPAEGNPSIPGGLPEVWSYGHRNPQAAALAPDGKLWTVEHGPRGGDELNQPEAGLNYGWPEVSYGVEYSGDTIGGGVTQKAGTEQPVYYWDPVIAPSGMVFYSGDMFPDLQGDALIGGLAGQALVRLKLSDDKVIGEARYLQGEGRVRDVDVDADDGAIMILTDADNGSLRRVTPGE